MFINSISTHISFGLMKYVFCFMSIVSRNSLSSFGGSLSSFGGMEDVGLKSFMIATASIESVMAAAITKTITIFNLLI
jgi:hypothetical protein